MHEVSAVLPPRFDIFYNSDFGAQTIVFLVHLRSILVHSVEPYK